MALAVEHSSPVPERDGSALRPEMVRPRWEWRTFATSLPLDAVPLPSSVGRDPSRERYLLSAESPDNVKVRDGRLEIKHLVQVGLHGLELWEPVAKFRLPVVSSQLTPLWIALAITPPSSLRATYDLESLVTEVVASDPRLMSAIVSKRRTQVRLEGCIVEHSEVWIEHERWETVAVEHEDPAHVVAVLRRLGLAHVPNTNYPNALKSILAHQRGHGGRTEGG